MPMSPWQSEQSEQSEQSAGLSTAESDRNHDTGNPPANKAFVTNVASPVAGEIKSPPTRPSPPPSPKSKPRRGLPVLRVSSFAKSKKSKDKTSSVDTSVHNGLSLNQSIGGSAPTILIHTPSTTSSDDDPSAAPLRQPLRSAMSSRTLHDSLHRGHSTPSKLSARPKVKRSISFANVNIREYERVLGDNPSVTSGPPLSIGWRYVPEPLVVKLDDYEEGKGLPRSSGEFLVPKAVRENLLREHAEVSRSEMVQTIRTIQKQKMHRRKTVVNLSMQPTEEKIESAKRKIKKILKPSSTYANHEAMLWDNAHAIAMEKAQKLEESLRRGESVSSRDLYRVGTPCNNIMPSRRNTLPRMNLPQNLEQETTAEVPLQHGGDSDHTSVTDGVNDLSLESLSKSMQYNPKPIGQTAEYHVLQEKISSVGDNHDSKHKTNESSHSRGSSTIVVDEEESDDIFAKLVLDSVGSRE